MSALFLGRLSISDVDRRLGSLGQDWEEIVLTDKELDELPKAKLEQLRKRVDAALDREKERRRKAALAAIKDVAKKHGVTLSAIVGAATTEKPKRKRRAAKPKFQHPEDSTVTWTGMGRKPRWFVDHLEGGGREEDLLIAA